MSLDSPLSYMVPAHVCLHPGLSCCTAHALGLLRTETPQRKKETVASFCLHLTSLASPAPRYPGFLPRMKSAMAEVTRSPNHQIQEAPPGHCSSHLDLSEPLTRLRSDLDFSALPQLPLRSTLFLLWPSPDQSLPPWGSFLCHPFDVAVSWFGALPLSLPIPRHSPGQVTAETLTHTRGPTTTGGQSPDTHLPDNPKDRGLNISHTELIPVFQISSCCLPSITRALAVAGCYAPSPSSVVLFLTLTSAP